MCMHLTTYSHAHTHMPMCKHLYTQTHAHTYVHESVHILSFSNTPTHMQMGRHLCTGTLLGNTHRYACSHGHVHAPVHALSLSNTHTHAYAYVHAAVHVLSHIHPCTPKGRALSLLGTHTDMHAHTPMCMYLPMRSRTQIYIHSHELCVGHQRNRLALTLGCPTPFQKSMTRTCAQQDGHL